MYDERDTRDTPHRSAIQALYLERHIVPVRQRFGCEALHRCSQAGQLSFHTGNWAFVGSDYGNALVNGRRVKILFVAMDRGGYGGADEEGFADTQASFRRSIELPRNPHMGGVALIMKHLVDERNPRKLSTQCALTNAVKCVQHTGSMSTKVTGMMISECASHLRAEIQALEPDIIVTQGGHPSDTVRTSFVGLRCAGEFMGESRGQAAVFANARVVILTTPHPARQAGLKWTRGRLPTFYLKAIAVARMELIRRLELGSGSA